MDLSPLTEGFQRRFEEKMAAREKALAASRRSIRSSANAIRAVHRSEFDQAHRLMEDSREALRAGRDAVFAEHPDVYFAGFLQDAQKEYAEARLTEALVTGSELPGPEELEVGMAPFLNGMAESIGEGRRAILDLLRKGRVAEGGLLVPLDPQGAPALQGVERVPAGRGQDERRPGGHDPGRGRRGQLGAVRSRPQLVAPFGQRHVLQRDRHPRPRRAVHVG